jgi:hypothetical protein
MKKAYLGQPTPMRGVCSSVVRIDLIGILNHRHPRDKHFRELKYSIQSKRSW